MENVNITPIVFVIIAGLALIIFVIVKNQKDKKDLNPDAQDAVIEEKTDAEQDREKL